MTRVAAYLLLALFFSACSLFHRDKGNEPPTLASSSADTLRVGHGGQVSLVVLAADEDDDQLFYQWDALGAGTFSSPDESSTVWVAPDSLTSSSETFILTVTVRDRDCSQVAVPEDRQRCEAAAASSQLLESFLVEVLRTTPTLDLDDFSTASFADPVLRLEARVNDEDGDPLEILWEQLEGEELLLRPLQATDGIAALEVIPLYNGEYRLSLRITDGVDTLSAETRLQVSPQRLPTGGMQPLDRRLPDASSVAFEIDRYEYPNERAAVPFVAESLFEAARLCAAINKRLCSVEEWRHACQGEAFGSYSSTDDPDLWGSRSFGRRFCNTPGSALSDQGVAASGSFPNCSAANEVYDLVGNSAEWVVDTDENGDWVGRVHLSDHTNRGDCSSFASPLEPIPAGTDLGTIGTDAFSAAAYDDYRVAGRGFRCCR
jgi:hypothetical protein